MDILEAIPKSMRDVQCMSSTTDLATDAGIGGNPVAPLIHHNGPVPCMLEKGITLKDCSSAWSCELNRPAVRDPRCMMWMGNGLS